MLAKKIAVLIATAAMSAPALADRGHSDHYRGGHGYYGGHGHVRHVVVHKPHYVVHHRPAVVHHYYRPAPRPVVHHYYHRPAPRPVYVVEQHNHVNPVAVLAGAVIGAAIVHHVVTGY
jgi:hypothetical protein